MVWIWNKSENDLKSFVNEINKKHHSVKFAFKLFKEKTEFLDRLIYKGHNNVCKQHFIKSQLTVKNYLHGKSTHPLSLKKSIPYSQALRIKRVCSTFDEYEKYSNGLVKRFVEQGTKKTAFKTKSKK